jgi:hypothetical protein
MSVNKAGRPTPAGAAAVRVPNVPSGEKTPKKHYFQFHIGSLTLPSPKSRPTKKGFPTGSTIN